MQQKVGGLMKAKPEYYREQARLSRDLAERTKDKAISSHLLSVADQYERLADEAEAKRR